MRLVVAFLGLATGAGLFAQVGYPGGYPPGQYPGGGLPAPSWPRKSKNGADSKSETPPAVQVQGKLSKIDEKTIVVDVPDGRVVQFQRDTKTKVYRESQEINASELKVGDEISAEGTQDKDGNLYATTIRVEKSPPAEAAKTEPAKTEAAAGDERPTATVDTPPPVRDPGDPGPPTLKRGAPARSQNVETAAVEIPNDPSVARPVARPAPAARALSEASDPVIEKARAAAETFSEKLPNYVCKEFMARFASMSHPVDWRALDVVSAEVVYEGGKESYRNVEVNGKARKSFEDTNGSWSTGEFASTLRDILSPWTAAEFHPRRNALIAGMAAKVYDFSVERTNSHWHVQVAAQSINPAYKGSLWIDPKSGRVLRIEMQARALPEEFPLDTVESAVDYENVRIGEGTFLLPAHAESLSCERGTSHCSRNVIDFRNYHKFNSETSITFADQK
jgi:hypothetical protein